jgi:phage tail sheath protein FI
MFISSRRMMGSYRNHLVLTYWQRVDWPINRRLIETIVNSESFYLNGLTPIYLLGGRIEFRPDENPITDLMNGIIKFHVFLGLTEPAEQIIFNVEFDPYYLLTLFG